MERDFKIGDLVESESEFDGIGKIVSLDEGTSKANVAFFESPKRHSVREIIVSLRKLNHAAIYDEANVFLQDERTGIWRRARYESQRPDGGHLVLYKADEPEVVSIADIYVLNLGDSAELEPSEFLESRYTDTPFFSDWRIPFVSSYIEQRAACRSISSILSSSVEIEPHQIAVVRRVLQDDVQRYLLADEVGLGKTIEACLIVREHVLQDEQNAHVLIAVPAGLIDQWRSELTDRFYLGDILDERVFICAHEKLVGAAAIQQPTMLVVDEAHQICPQAWSEDEKENAEFRQIAQCAQDASTCLLLSGTPLVGNERNFLAMLNLLSPDSYELSEPGQEVFRQRLQERERLGGIYQALVPGNDNDTLTGLVDELEHLFPDDKDLLAVCEDAKPLIDWQAPEDAVERTSVIKRLRSYIGEHYRLHQRMLRNRRVDPAIVGLFPGLAGVTRLKWSIDDQGLSVDQLLDAARDEVSRGDIEFDCLGIENYVDWVRAYLVSPMLVSNYASNALSNQERPKHDDEAAWLEHVIDCANTEQKSKDDQLRGYLAEFGLQHPKAKFVIFCGDAKVADHVFTLLAGQFEEAVERHNARAKMRFGIEEEVRILVCDRSGEDGLNLHGGEKVLIHYSVPLSFSRIEQRNGRANRYSAAIHARPVQSVVLLPGREGIFGAWIDVLADAVKIFDRSVASLQYVLQDRIDQAWRKVPTSGIREILELHAELDGPDGLLEREERRVEAQEQLNSMNEEVEHCAAFAESLERADQKAEDQAKGMSGWITKALHFKWIPGTVEGAFRFGYSAGGSGKRTLVDVVSFLDKCLTGIDKENSTWREPVTAMMSPDRQLVSLGGQIYPLRFGQPFVDTIYDLSKTDTRGISSCRIRAVTGIEESAAQAYFRLSWIKAGCAAGSSRRQQRIADEQIEPQFITNWVDESGKELSDDFLEAILAAPYSKKPKALGQGIVYRDLNVNHNYWSQLEDYYPEDAWPGLVRAVVKKSKSLVGKTRLTNNQMNGLKESLQLEAISVTVLVRS